MATPTEGPAQAISGPLGPADLPAQLDTGAAARRNRGQSLASRAVAANARRLPPGLPHPDPDYSYDASQDQQAHNSIQVNHCRAAHQPPARSDNLPEIEPVPAYDGQNSRSATSVPGGSGIREPHATYRGAKAPGALGQGVRDRPPITTLRAARRRGCSGGRGGQHLSSDGQVMV
jgi:hypothetical protein